MTATDAWRAGGSTGCTQIRAIIAGHHTGATRRLFWDPVGDADGECAGGGSGGAAPYGNFLAACLAESLPFATAVAKGSTDPTWNNADANPQRPDWDANTYPLDATAPWLRTQDQPDDTVLKA